MEDMVALLKQQGLQEDQIQRRVTEWSSDQTKRLKAEDETCNVSSIRMNQALHLAPFGKGDMIIAIPEVVSYLLADPRRKWITGHSRFSIFDLLGFDHIVFDECHTIEPRGFGLSAIFAYFSSQFPEQFPVKVSYLSATSPNLTPVLTQFGVAEKNIIELSEPIIHGNNDTQTTRTIHGDVHLQIIEQDRLYDVIEQQIDSIKTALEQGTQVVIIYDALISLREQVPGLENLFQQHGLNPEDCLLMNSIDDSVATCKQSGHFSIGRTLNPLKYKILIATASIEMGVTFKANLLFMEPGFEASSFLQRYGRAARGDANGNVLVRVDEKNLNQRRWLKRLYQWLQQKQGQTITIDELSEQLMASYCQLFEARIANPEKDTQGLSLNYFGELPSQATYAAGVYWNLLENHSAMTAHYQQEHLKKIRPLPARQIYQKLKTVERLKGFYIPDIATAAEKWCDLFSQQALKLRNIARSIEVVEAIENGKTLQVQEIWLERYTNILSFPIQLASRGGQQIVQIHIPDQFDVFLTGERKHIQQQVTTLFPHTLAQKSFDDDYQITNKWCRELKNKRNPDTQDVLNSMPETLKAAELLTRMTGLVVTEESEIIESSPSMVL
jgi:hypothetical protein